MVATWNPAANSAYYLRGHEYYLGSLEPAGQWYAPTGAFGLVDGAEVERDQFERLYAAIGPDGNSLLPRSSRRLDRVPAFDYTFSAPRSVSLAWGFASPELKGVIEAAHDRAVRAALDLLAREATWARRGKGGTMLEPVALSAALFQHGESRPAEHADGQIFGDANLHQHAVAFSLAERQDGSTGAIHSKVMRDWKLALGARYHGALAYELGSLGFPVDRIGYNGTFEIAGVEDSVLEYFSARRREIEEELAIHGVTSRAAAALAAAVTRGTRDAKPAPGSRSREAVWADAARSLGVVPETFTEALRGPLRIIDRQAAEQEYADRVTAIPRELTEMQSVFERRDLYRAVSAALVGTGLPAECAEVEVARLLADDAVIEIGRDGLGLPRYSTPEMVEVERQVVALARHLAGESWTPVDRKALLMQCEVADLSPEQTAAAVAATGGEALSIVEGAPGSGKTTTLGPVVKAYKNAGYRVIGTATAWRIARMLEDELGIEARATASWIEKARRGQMFLDSKTVLLVDEAGLLSSRDMHALLVEVRKHRAKVVFVGDRGQLQSIGAGPGLDLIARAVDAARVEAIVRQRDAWARDAIRAFGAGDADAALEAFAEHGLLIERSGATAVVTALVDEWQAARVADPQTETLLLAKTNAHVASLSRAVRERFKAEGTISGPDFDIAVTTPSGHPSVISLAVGDRIRFLVRNDRIGVINGSVGTVTAIDGQADSTRPGGHTLRVEAVVEGRSIVFDPHDLSDDRGRVRLGWAYASSIYGSQGLTVDRAFVLVDPALDRHDIYVAASRARGDTTLMIDAKAIDRHIRAARSIDLQSSEADSSPAERRRWLATRLARSAAKLSTVAVIEASQKQAVHQRVAHDRPRGHDYEL